MMSGASRRPTAARVRPRERLADGARVGRFVVVRDMDGRTHAVAAQSVAAACETDDGTVLMLPGGKLVHVPRALATVLDWLDGRGP